jgi:hypothetical protein
MYDKPCRCTYGSCVGYDHGGRFCKRKRHEQWPQSVRGDRVGATMEPSDRGGRYALAGDALYRAEVLRDTLEALERLLRLDPSDTCVFISPDWRRAIRDVVLGPLDYWLGNNANIPGPDGWDRAKISDPFWLALQQWVGHGHSSRELLLSSIRNVLTQIDSALHQKNT